jgi:hypothetical protein
MAKARSGMPHLSETRKMSSSWSAEKTRMSAVVNTYTSRQLPRGRNRLVSHNMTMILLGRSVETNRSTAWCGYQGTHRMHTSTAQRGYPSHHRRPDRT